MPSVIKKYDSERWSPDGLTKDMTMKNSTYLSQLQCKMDLINNTKTFSNSTTEDELSDIDVVQIIGKSLFLVFAMIGLMSNIALIRIYKKKDLSMRFNSLSPTLCKPPSHTPPTAECFERTSSWIVVGW